MCTDHPRQVRIIVTDNLTVECRNPGFFECIGRRDAFKVIAGKNEVDFPFILFHCQRLISAILQYYPLPDGGLNLEKVSVDINLQSFNFFSRFKCNLDFLSPIIHLTVSYLYNTPYRLVGADNLFVYNKLEPEPCPSPDKSSSLSAFENIETGFIEPC